MKHRDILKKINSMKMNVEDRYINNPEYKNRSLNIDLSEPVVIYNDGKKWKCVQVKTLLCYPIIHDIYFDNETVKQKDMLNISLTFCPFTYTPIVYEGTYQMTGEVYQNNIIIRDMENPTRVLLQIDGIAISPNGDEMVRKWEAKVMRYRDAITYHPDSLFLPTSFSEDKLLVPLDYFHTSTIIYPLEKRAKVYHPKTLVYGIEYYNKGKLDYSVVVGKDAGKEPSGIDINKSGVYDYLSEHLDGLIEKTAVIIPCFWFAWIAIHPETKVVELK